MKYFLSILLLLTMLFCSCTVSPGSDQTQSTGAVDRGDGAVSGEVHSDIPMQLIREYQTTEISSGVGLSKVVEDIFPAEDGYWVCFSVYEDSEYKTRLERYTEAGELVETVYVPQPKGLSEDGLELYRAFTACPLRDGQWFLLTDLYDGTNTYPQAFILSAEGDVLHSMTVPFPITFGTYCARSDGDGGLYFLIHDDTRLWYYDETLTERAVIEVPDRGTFSADFAQYTGDVFCIDRNASDGRGEYQIDLSEQSINVVKRELPEEFRYSSFIYGLNGEIYVIENEGISRYTDDGALIPILKWAECGLQKQTDGRTFWIVNDTAILRRYSETVERKFTEKLAHIAVVEREVPIEYQEIRMKICMDLGLEWLTAAISEFNNRNSQYHVTAEIIAYNEFNDVLLFDEETDILVADNVWRFSEHYDKQAFLDISSELQGILLDGVYDSYVTADGALYSFPLSLSLTTLVAKSDCVGDAPLTWENLYAYRDALAEDAYLIAPEYIGGAGSYIVDSSGQKRPLDIQMSDMIQYMYRNALVDYVDYEGMTSSFDSPQFRDMIQFLDWLSSHVDANIGGLQLSDVIGNRISNGLLVNRIRGDGVAFVEANIQHVLHFSLLQRIYGEHEYTLCGYPSADGGYFLSNSGLYPAILADTDVKDGCLEFFRFLVSDEMQSHALFRNLPVTLSAMKAQLEANRYQYFYTNDIEMLENGSSAEVRLMEIDSWHEAVEDYNKNILHTCEEYCFTEEDIAQILDFYSGIRVRSDADTNILSIVNEELSYWRANARSLEETTKIIDSRVWIYLNE